MAEAREWSKEEKQWITDNLSYVPETGDLIWKGCASSVNNKIRAAGSVAGTLSNGYLNIANYSVKGDRHNYRAHRIVWFLNYGEVPSMLDHINGNRVDNRIENLRPTTNALNLKNQNPRKGSASKYKGVYINNYGLYRTMTSVNGKQFYIGVSKTEKEAAVLYDKWLEENLTPLEREYAKTNKELGLL
jgi:hypothetical protein